MAKKKISYETLLVKVEYEATNLRRVADWIEAKSEDLPFLDRERDDYRRQVAVLRASADSIVALAAFDDPAGVGATLTVLGRYSATILLGVRGLIGFAGDVDGVLDLSERLREAEEPIAECVASVGLDGSAWSAVGVVVEINTDSGDQWWTKTSGGRSGAPMGGRKSAGPIVTAMPPRSTEAARLHTDGVDN